MTDWPLVPLGELLVERKERIGSLDANGLPLLGVSNRDGLHRSTLPRIPDMSRYLRVEPEWFAYNPMRVNVGSIGWAHHEDLAGVISPDYVVFSCTDKVKPGLLHWFLTSEIGLRAIRLQTFGSVRERLYFDSLAKVAIPLPPVEQQGQIVEQIEHFSEEHTLLRKLRSESEVLFVALNRSILFSCQEAVWTPMDELVSLRQPDINVERQKSYQFAGVYCFGKGVFRGQEKSGTEFAYDRLTRIKTGEFTYPKLMAWEGALGIVPPECDGCFVSPEYPVFTVDSERVLPEVLDVYFRTPSVWPILAEASTGTNVRRRRLHPTAFLNLTMPVPPVPTQIQIRKARQAAEAASTIRRRSEDELKSLLSAALNSFFNGTSCGQIETCAG